MSFYYDDVNRYLLVSYDLKNRETVFLNKEGLIIRGIKANHPKYLLQNANRYDLSKNKFNIYKSIATFRDLPLFSWNQVTRRKQYDIWTNQQIYLANIIDYDFYLDFDNKKNFDLVKTECLIVSDYLDSKNIKHKIIFSGSGLHIKAKLIKEDRNPEKCKRFHDYLKDKFWLTTTDPTIYRWQGLIKAENSIDFKTMRVCKPIRKDLLKDFKPDDYKYKGGY